MGNKVYTPFILVVIFIATIIGEVLISTTLTKSRNLMLDNAKAGLATAEKMGHEVDFQSGQTQMLLCLKYGKGCEIKSLDEYMAFSKAGGYK